MFISYPVTQNFLYLKFAVHIIQKRLLYDTLLHYEMKYADIF